MRVELFYIPDCPNHRPAAQLLKEILREQGLPEEISEVPVVNAAQAEELAFLGSPTIQVDGRDVDATPSKQLYSGLSCRNYIVDGKPQGVPSGDMITGAIRAAL